SNAYKDLMYIIQHLNFHPEHIINNIRRLKSLCNRLSLQTIKCHQVPIQNMKTSSTSTPFKNFYTISISEHIRRILGNKSLRSQMYFGPGIEAKTKSEFWHRNIWQESPLFSPSSIRIDHKLYLIESFIKYKDEETRIGRILAIVSTSNGIKLKIQHLYFGTELPRIFASSIRKE
ncbi:3538_t:CDS:2, partial [Dentiscutata heterogama]